jgi:hypothetical protein
MKKICLFFIPVIAYTFVNAQSVGIGTTTPDSSTVLHVDAGSNISKGFLVTGAHNNAATIPDLGQGNRLMFYPGKVAFRAGFAFQTRWDNANVGAYSVAFGLGTMASGVASFAMGNSAKATGTLSSALGNGSIASGDYATAIGNQTAAYGVVATSLGSHTIAKGFASTVIGVYNDSILATNLTDNTSNTNPLFIVGNGSAENARSNAMVVLKNGSVGIGTNAPFANALLHVDAGSASKCFLVSGQSSPDATIPNIGGGTRMMFFPGKSAFRAGRVFSDEWNNTNVGSASVAMGYGTIASGAYSVALGDRSEATYETSTAFGWRTKATAFATTAMGATTVASGEISTAMGNVTIARGYASTVVGLFNDPILAAPQTDVTSTTPLFIVGNGASGALSNAMVVLKNGNVGIGTNAPGEKLVLNASASATLQLQAAGVDKAFVQLSGDNLRLGTYSSNDLGNVTFRLNGSDRFIILPNGNATLTGTLTQNSDERFKQDITPINNALDKVMQLNGYEYYWKPELQRDSSLQIGLIAQNVEKVLPQLVATDKEGLKSVAYQNMVPVLVEAIKELQQQIKDQQQQIKDLKTKASN